MAKPHHLKLLGVPALIDHDGQPLMFRTRKHLGLLVYLTLEAPLEPVTRETLVNLLWPGPAKSPFHSLSQGLSEIRALLGHDALVSNRTQVKLRIDLPTDIDLYNLNSLPKQIPTLFEGLESCAGSDFAQWVEAKRDRILTQIETALRQHLREARAYGHGTAVRERAEQLHSVDRYDEEAIQALIGDHLYEGNWAAAIRLFQKHAEDTRADLGRPPSTETMASLRRLERRILEPQQLGGIRFGAPHSVKPKKNVFIGRESPLARLEALSNQVFASSQFRSCMLRGPDGVGKTAVLRRFIYSVAGGPAPVYMVTCQMIGQGLPFAALSDLLEQMSRDPALSGTHPMWLAEASRIAPGIRAAYDGIPVPPVTQPDTVRVRLGQALKEMLQAVSDGGPFLLAFDDLHYMDPASRDVLHMLSRRLDGSPALLLATACCPGADTGLGIGDGMAGVDWQETIDLPWLEDGEITAVVSALTAADEAATDAVKLKIVDMAEGSPLLAEMLVTDWRKSDDNSLVMVNLRGDRDHVSWRPPDIMQSAFKRQYSGLSKCAMRLVHLLATAGKRMPLEDICRLLAVPSETVGGAVFSLIERGIVSLESNTLGFKNDLHRVYVYSELLPDETRKYQHAHLAQHLRASKDQSEFQHAFEASHHFLKAEWIDEARELACNGAERAITWGAPEVAQKALEAVIAADPSSTATPLYLFLARALVALGRYKHALDALARWRPESPTQNEEALAAAVRGEALHRGRLADDDEALAASVAHAIAASSGTGDQRMVIGAKQIAAEVAYESGNWDLLGNIEEECAAVERDTQDTEVRGLANIALGYCRLVSDDPEVASDRFTRAAGIFRTLKLDSKLHRALTGLGMSNSRIGQYDNAVDAFKRAAVSAERSGDAVSNANALLNLGSLASDLGRFAQAAGHFRAAIDLDTDISTSRVTTALYCNAANLSLALGNHREADMFLLAATTAAEQSQLWQHFVNVRLTGADLHLAKGEVDAAWTLVKEALMLTAERHRLVPDLGQYWRLRIHYFTITGDDGARPSETPKLATVAHSLELQAFEECLKNDYQMHCGDTPAQQQLIQHGLFGVLARLAAVGVSCGQIPSATEEISGARAVADAFPDKQWEVIPAGVLDVR